MPNRILKESICSSDTINELTWFEETFWYRLIVNCDDFGRFDGRAAILKSRLFPLKSSVTDKNVEEALNKLSSVGLVERYLYGNKPYLQLVTWSNHQQMRTQKSKYPSPDDEKAVKSDSYNQLISDDCKCHRNPIQSESNPNTNPNTNSAAAPRKNFVKPTVDEIKAYCTERNNNVDAERFIDYYESNGWMVGKTKMKDWKATVRNWERRDANGLPRANTKNSTTGNAGETKEYGNML